MFVNRMLLLILIFIVCVALNYFSITTGTNYNFVFLEQEFNKTTLKTKLNDVYGSHKWESILLKLHVYIKNLF